jgi:hypothetical protein
MEEYIKDYNLLTDDVKHQISFIYDYYEFNFEHIINTLNELKELQNKIRKV